MPQFDFNPTPQRSENMRKIVGKNTAPELRVRQLIRSIGFTGYRLHRRELPGKPDVAWIGKRLAVFVHGCFWHGHDCKVGARKPKSNRDYWIPKIEGNKSRDQKHEAELQSNGWRVLTIWECELRDQTRLTKRLRRFLA